MRAGNLDRRATIERSVDSQDASGDPVKNWGTLVEVWALIEPLRGRELYSASQIIGELDTKITIRWAPALNNLTDKDRVSHQGVVYNIVQVSHVRLEHREIELFCKSGANLG